MRRARDSAMQSSLHKWLLMCERTWISALYYIRVPYNYRCHCSYEIDAAWLQDILNIVRSTAIHCLYCVLVVILLAHRSEYCYSDGQTLPRTGCVGNGLNVEICTVVRVPCVENLRELWH